MCHFSPVEQKLPNYADGTSIVGLPPVNPENFVWIARDTPMRDKYILTVVKFGFWGPYVSYSTPNLTLISASRRPAGQEIWNNWILKTVYGSHTHISVPTTENLTCTSEPLVCSSICWKLCSKPFIRHFPGVISYHWTFSWRQSKLNIWCKHFSQMAEWNISCDVEIYFSISLTNIVE